MEGSDSDSDWDVASELLVSAIKSNISPEKLPLSRIASSSNRQAIQPLLLLLDMNGTLIYRSETKVALLKSPIKKKVGGKYYYYFRPHAANLVKYLMGRAGVQLAFYTSMSLKYAVPAAQHLGGRDLFLYDHGYNKRDVNSEDAWATVRDLPKLWNAAGTPAFGHNERSTIMIDDSLRKNIDFPENALLLPEYTAEGVALQHDERTIFHTQTLLERVIDKWQSVEEQEKDIRSILSAELPEFTELLRLGLN